VESVTHTKGIAHELVFSRFLVGAGWDSVLHPIGRWDGIPSVEPAAAIGRGHLLHIVWLDQDVTAQVVAFYLDLVTGKAGEAVKLSESGHNVADPTISTDGGGRVHVVWSEIGAGGQSMLRHRWRGASGWEPVISVPTGQGIGAYSPDLAGDPEGNLQLAWTNAFNGGSTPRFLQRTPDGMWRTPEAVAAERPGWYAGAPAVAADQDRVWVVWAETDDRESRVVASVRTEEGWSPVRHPSRLGRFATEPSATLDPWGTLHLLWLERDPGELESAAAIAYSSAAAGDTVFAAPRLLTLSGAGPFKSPTIAADASGRVLAAWVDEGVTRGGTQEGAPEVTRGEIVCRAGVAGFTALAPEFWRRP
jgi:hypothetical protein